MSDAGESSVGVPGDLPADTSGDAGINGASTNPDLVLTIQFSPITLNSPAESPNVDGFFGFLTLLEREREMHFEFRNNRENCSESGTIALISVIPPLYIRNPYL